MATSSHRFLRDTRSGVPPASRQKYSTSKKSILTPLRPNYEYHGSYSRQKEVRFYDTYGQYGEFTNFYPCHNLVIDGVEWRTTEHYFQAQKFIGTPYVEHIRELRTAREAFQFARELKVQSWIRSDWHRVKEDVMKKALLHKFLQNDSFKRILLDTEEKKLVEHTFNDSYWGDGGDGTGKNRLGILLMDVRDTLRAQQKALEKQKSSRKKLYHWQDSPSRSSSVRYARSSMRRSSSFSDISSNKSGVSQTDSHKLPSLHSIGYKMKQSK